jgi:hypothetical protein
MPACRPATPPSGQLRERGARIAKALGQRDGRQVDIAQQFTGLQDVAVIAVTKSRAATVLELPSRASSVSWPSSAPPGR